MKVNASLIIRAFEAFFENFSIFCKNKKIAYLYDYINKCKFIKKCIVSMKNVLYNPPLF